MAFLFEVPKRAGKQQDSRIAKKTRTAVKTPTTVRGGSDLFSRITEINNMVEKNLGEYREKYQVIDNKDQLIDYIDHCIASKYISIDTETTGLDPLRDKLVGACIYGRGYKGSYIPVNHVSYITGERIENQLPVDFVMQQFERLQGVDIDMFNAKFDIRFLRANGWKEAYCTWDGYLASQILNENEPTHGLKALHKKYVLENKKDAFSFDALFRGITFDKIPIQTGYLYAANDPVVTTELCDYQRKYLREDSEREDIRRMYWVFKNIEMAVLPVVATMEDTGIEFDTEYQQELSEKYNQLLEQKEKAFYKACKPYEAAIEEYRSKAGRSNRLDNPISIGSPTQIAVLLYDIIGIQSSDDKKPRGTGEDVLAKVDNPVCKALLEYREIAKLVSTYIDKLPGCVNPSDGRIHCSFNQYGARTGRFSCSDPNLQNIPSHNKDIRKMFKATDGYVLMSSDYSQQEPKVMTQMCGDPKMIQAYMEGKDLYAEIAALSFNTTYDNCLEFRPDGTTNKEGKERRSQAKSILLGVLYGRGVPSIAEQLGTTTKRAQAIKDSVFKGFPAIPKFEEDSLAMAEELGYVTTLWGRKRRLPDLQLPDYEIVWEHVVRDTSFDGMNPPEYDEEDEVPEETQRYYLRKLAKTRGFSQRVERQKIFKEAKEEGIRIIDNTSKIADASRQAVNSRIQGSAADMSKLAMVLVGNDKRLKELGFRLLIPVHDELIAECPEQHAKECRDRFAMLMAKAAESRLTIPIKCDVETTRNWYGDVVDVEKLK